MPPKKGKAPVVQENVSLGPQVAEGVSLLGSLRRVSKPALLTDPIRHAGLWRMPYLRILQ